MFYRSFRFCYCNISISSVARRSKMVHDHSSANIKVLMELFGFTGQQVRDLMTKYKSLGMKETAELTESYKFFKKLGFSNDDLLKYPKLLVAHPVIKINHYNSLQDTGCKPIDARLLSSAYFRRPVVRFKTDGYLEWDINVADRLLTCIDPSIEKPQILRQDLKILDQMSWTEIHRAILVDWLKKRLNATDNDMTKLFRIHRMIKNKSFRIINENIILAESLGLSNEKILKCGYLLSNHPEYPKKMLRDYPFFSGIDWAKAYKANPKMMMISPRRVMEIYKILKEYNISDELIKNKSDVLAMSPYTLRERLEHLQNTPETRVLFTEPFMLKLVVHHNKVKPRLSFLKNLKLRCASMTFIGVTHGPLFEEYIQEGKDVNIGASVVNFFARLLDKKKEDVQGRLRKHPYYCYVPYVDIDETFQYLINARYSKENIFRCLHILLYPSFKIQNATNLLRKENHLNFNSLSQCKQLNLILYRIEKEHHFTGNGIWRTDLQTGKIDEHLLE